MRGARADRRPMGAAAEDGLAEADLADPTPDLQELFRHYDALYFRGALAAVDFAVKWGSSLQSSSFGSCTFSKPSNTITLFEPVLKYRSCTDLKKALLHEMIHAIIYVKHHRKDSSTHGPVFRAWMDAINSCSIKDPQRPVSGYNITTRHDFRPEKPFSFRGLLWKCELCGDTIPRASKLGPPSDACCIENVDHDATCGNMLCDWHNHKSACGGSYESRGLQSVTPVRKEVPKGTQLLLTYPSETSKSKGAIQESSSAGSEEDTVTKPNSEDGHLSLSSLMKAAKRRRSEVVLKARALAVEPPNEVKQKQDLVAMEKHGLFSAKGCSNAKSVGSSSSKKAGKQHKPNDVQKPNVPPPAHLQKPKRSHQLVSTERHGHFSLEGCSNGKSVKRSPLQKTGKQCRSEVVDKVSVPPDEPPKETNRKQAFIAKEEEELFSPGDCNDAKSFPNGTPKKASKLNKPKDIQELGILPAVPQGKPKRKQNLVPTETHDLLYLEDCNDAKTAGIINAKKAGKQPKLEDVESPSAPLAASQGKPKLRQELVTTQVHELFSLEACNYAKPHSSDTSEQAGEQQKEPKSAQKACLQHAYPLRKQKKDSVAPEKNELFHVMACSHEKLLDKSSKKACKQHEPEDIRKVSRCKAKNSKFVASQKQQRNSRRQPARKKEFAVMCEWMNIYESDRSSDSTEPLVNKRTERRKRKRERERERERIQTYSRSKKACSAPLDNSRVDVLVSSHKSGTGSCKGELVQQSWPPPPCSHNVLPITAGHVVTQATGGYYQTSAPCLDIVLLQPAEAHDSVPPDSTTIDISDDD